MIRKIPVAFLVVVFGILSLYGADKKTWYRGQLHTHSFWSDGRAFPEEIIEIYKKRGYHFLALTEHNQFASKEKWRDIEKKTNKWPPKITPLMFHYYLNTYGEKWCEYKITEKKKSVRLKTYQELKKKFEKPGKFILMPGVEITQKLNRKLNKYSLQLYKPT